LQTAGLYFIVSHGNNNSFVGSLWLF